MRALCLVFACVLVAAPATIGQILVAPAASLATAGPRPAASPTPTAISLNLCVDAPSNFPCPVPVISDLTYIPAITLTYGQILDGAVTYSPNNLTSGSISIYKDRPTNPVPICVLRINIDLMCPNASTIFDVGDYTLTASLTFNSDPDFTPSDALPVQVSVSRDTSTIMLSSSGSPATFGSVVTITATATGGYGAIPTGQVVFTVDGVTLAPANIDATGKASFSTSTLSIGTHRIEASYAGALDFYAAADAVPLAQQITPPDTTTTIVSSLNPSVFSDNVTFTASVVAPAGTPSGAVTFKDGTAAFATVLVTPKGGQNLAQTTISTLAVGSHNITATYSGDSSGAASVSAALVQQVNYPLQEAPPGYKITVDPSPVVMGVGQTADLTVTVTPISGFSSPVTLSCADLPNESACSFGETVIPAGGGQTTLAFSTMAPHDCGSTVPYFRGSALLNRPSTFWLGGTAPLLAGVFLLCIPRRFRRGRWTGLLMAVVMVCGLMTLSGCGGNCTDFGTTPGNYTFKVNGTAPGIIPVVTTVAPATSDPTAIDVSTSVALSVKF